MSDDIEVGDTVELPDGPEGEVVALVGDNGVDVRAQSTTKGGNSLYRALKKDCKLVKKGSAK